MIHDLSRNFERTGDFTPSHSAVRESGNTNLAPATRSTAAASSGSRGARA